MTIHIFFSPDSLSLIPDHVRITRSISGETGTVTFTFNNIDLFNSNNQNIEYIDKISIKTPDYIYYTKDIRIIWANGKPTNLEAVVVINNKEMFDSFFQNLKIYGANKGLVFIKNF
jgi:photosystem II 13kDa protein